ncbi:MAG: GNAT family N-acetyltransferase [Planctomycetota bacterium]
MEADVTVRAARPEDAERLVDFNLRLARETEDRALDVGVLTCGLNAILADASRGFYLVAEIGGQIAGCLMVTFEWSDWRNGTFWWIQSVYVPHEYRRRGVFRALYDDVRRRAKNSENVCGCRLYVERDNTPAQATYMRMGFCETGYKVLEEVFE